MLESAPRLRLSDRTLIDIDDLCARLVLVRQQGYEVSDGENAYGLQTVAVPLLGSNGRARAAVSLTSRREVVTFEDFVAAALPALNRVADSLSRAISLSAAA